MNIVASKCQTWSTCILFGRHMVHKAALWGIWKPMAQMSLVSMSKFLKTNINTISLDKFPVSLIHIDSYCELITAAQLNREGLEPAVR